MRAADAGPEGRTRGTRRDSTTSPSIRSWAVGLEIAFLLGVFVLAWATLQQADQRIDHSKGDQDDQPQPFARCARKVEARRENDQKPRQQPDEGRNPLNRPVDRRDIRGTFVGRSL